MKTMLLFVAFCAAFVSMASAQLQLNSGESFSYSFSNLPKTGSVPVFGSNPGGTMQVTVNNGSFQSGDQLKLEMFESVFTDPAICSAIMNSAPPYTTSCTSDFAWQDQQGAIRLTMQSGSAIIDSITVKAIVSGPSLSSYDVYSVTFTPVPEPGVLSLIACGIGLLVLGRSVQRRITTSS